MEPNEILNHVSSKFGYWICIKILYTSNVGIGPKVQQKKYTILISFRCCYMLNGGKWKSKRNWLKCGTQPRRLKKIQQWSSHTRAVLPLLSDSFGSRPRFNKWCNNKSSPLSAAKQRVRGRSILPRANMFSVSKRTPSIIGSLESFKCC